MEFTRGFSGAIGHTPLIQLEGLSRETGCTILGKAEFMNPGGSVKDRAALAIVEAAEASDALAPGGTVVEGTAGNTGIALAHLCKARGYRCVVFIPDTQSEEKMALLRALGVDLRPVPAVPYSDDNHYQKQAGRAAESLENAIWANQFDNTANAQGHYRTTGPEIWQQTGGRIDAFTCATGTAGTLAGVSRYLKEQDARVRIWLADPAGSALHHYIHHGTPKADGTGSIAEGIGTSRVTANMAQARVDDALMIDDHEAVPMVFRLRDEEGLLMGASTGINVCAAREVAYRLGPGHTIVTVLCDLGRTYLSRLYDPAWLASKGLGHAMP